MRLLITFLLLTFSCFAKSYKVKDSQELQKRAQKAKPGDQLILTADQYRGGVTLTNIRGTKTKPIVIEGRNNPVFQNGSEGLHLVDCHYVIIRNITIKGFPVNGINIDDGSQADTPPQGIILEKLTVLDIGPKGNHDAIKLSGLQNFQIKDCIISGWGGAAIDMVGCQKGNISGCKISGKEGFSQASGIQIKGGCSEINVTQNQFIEAGSRTINLGGSTGLQWFRPKGANYEAKDILVTHNRFQGSESFIAFVTCINGRVENNTFVEPGKWVLRILQETKDPHFLQCQKGLFKNNLVVFDKRVRTFVNVGPNTLPQTFTFSGNAWFDKSGSRKPNLPVKEKKGIYGVDPRLDQDLKITNRKLKGVGAEVK